MNFSQYKLSHSSSGQFEAGYYWNKEYQTGGSNAYFVQAFEGRDKTRRPGGFVRGYSQCFGMPQKIDATEPDFPNIFPTGMGIFGHHAPCSIMMMPEGARRIIGQGKHGNFTVYHVT